MELCSSFSFVLALTFAAFVAATSGAGDVFYVEDKDGWIVANPAGSYGRGVGRHQIRVDDIIGTFLYIRIFTSSHNC